VAADLNGSNARNENPGPLWLPTQSKSHSPPTTKWPIW
jgi:hypothetical protein